LDIEFIYDLEESKYTGLECYSIYDFTDNDFVYDIKLKKSIIALDTTNKIIYFLNMETEEHYILAKNYYYKIIKEFMDKAVDYNCKDFTVFEDCTGGQIYYKYN
jgi:hypothetical protein